MTSLVIFISIYSELRNIVKNVFHASFRMFEHVLGTMPNAGNDNKSLIAAYVIGIDVLQVLPVEICARQPHQSLQIGAALFAQTFCIAIPPAR